MIPLVRESMTKSLETLAKIPRKLDLSLLSTCLGRSEEAHQNPNGERFYKAYQSLPTEVGKVITDFSGPIVTLKSDASVSVDQVRAGLQGLCPWRKGPFSVFGVDIDAEWRSELKWQRILPFLPNLQQKVVLDVGSSSGYYMFRMAAHQPRLVLGIDPTPLFYYQFHSLKRYLPSLPLEMLPMGLEDMIPFDRYFDVVFCMGILYHQRSPVDALKRLRALLVPGGALVLETLYYPGKLSHAFFPKDRYAGMRNVQFIPTESCLTHWLLRAGFKEIQVCSKSKTTVQEQRRTAWSPGESLTDFLGDRSQTIEGYPGPRRLLLNAR